MDASRWERINDLFHAALAREAGSRTEFLARACGADGELQREVESLLRANEDADTFMSAGIQVVGLPRSESRLTAGERIGIYEVGAPLGAGGMGEVYRAVDTRLGREVALKVLPRSLATDADSALRLQREAQVLASLGHPNIAAIHGLEHSDHGWVLVLELVEGETLAAHLRAGPLPLVEALRVAVEATRGLEAAHEKGVVHRDLKPANIKLAPDGRVKLLDFGLAKVWWDESLHDVDSASSQQGAIMGTPAYMSPEQVRGAKVDPRADIWALGVVLWEMLAGRPPFRGDSVADCLVAVVSAPLDWSALPPDLPLSVHRVLRHCLQRDPKQRARSIADVRLDLEEVEAVEAPPAPPTRVARALPWLALLGALLASGWLGLRFTAGARATPLTHLALRDAAFTRQSSAAISADGRLIAYQGTQGPPLRLPLYVRAIDRPRAFELSGSRGARNPFFSPDGRALAFFRDRALWRVDIDTDACPGTEGVACGGAPSIVCATDETPDAPAGTWLEDGTIVLSRAIVDGRPWPGLARVPSTGGAARPLTTVDEAHGERAHSTPEAIRGRRFVLFTVNAGGRFRVEAASLDGGERRLLVEDASSPAIAPGGRLLVFRTDAHAVQAIPFDAEAMRVTGAPSTVLGDVLPGGSAGKGSYAVSANGTLIYSDLTADPSWQREVVWVTRDGQATPLLPQVDAWSQPRLSPDNGLLAIRTIRAANCDLWLFSLARQTLTRLYTGGDDHDPVFHPGGRRIAFTSARDGGRFTLWTRGVGEADSAVMVPGGNEDRHSPEWTPDGHQLVFTRVAATGQDIWIRDVDGAGFTPAERALVQTSFNERQPAVSPDGHWLAYTSDASGRDEVYVADMRTGQARVQVSSEGGSTPRWSHDGRELFFIDADLRHLMHAALGPGDPPVPGRAQVLFAQEFSAGREARPYDVSADGRRFVVVRGARPEAARTDMHVVLGWADAQGRTTVAREE